MQVWQWMVMIDGECFEEVFVSVIVRYYARLNLSARSVDLTHIVWD